MNKVYMYNINKKLFYRIGDIKNPRYYHSMLHLKGNLFIIGGICNNTKINNSKIIN